MLNRDRLHPYNVRLVHEILPPDFQRRLDFCSWLLQKDIEDYTFLEKILFTDEAQFSKNGIINLHNLHSWSEQNPHTARQTRSQFRFSVLVWAEIIGNRLIGPHILPHRLNSEAYLQFLRDDLPCLLENISLQLRRDMWFQHDGAPAHTTNRIRDWINSKYPNRWIGRNGPFLWPARSPHLTPLDFFLWGTMKDLMYSTEVNTRDELISRINEAGNNIREILRQTDLTRSLKPRALLCVQQQGGHIENIL